MSVVAFFEQLGKIDAATFPKAFSAEARASWIVNAAFLRHGMLMATPDWRLPQNWAASSMAYSFRYKHPEFAGRIFSMKAVPLAGNVIINAKMESDTKLVKLTLAAKSLVSKDTAPFATADALLAVSQQVHDSLVRELLTRAAALESNQPDLRALRYLLAAAAASNVRVRYARRVHLVGCRAQRS